MNRKNYFHIAWIFILAISICGAIMTYVTVPQGDDAIGYSQSKELSHSLGLEYTFPDIPGTIINGYNNTNGRVSTPLTDLLIIMLPSWTLALLNGAFILSLLVLIYKVSLFSITGRNNIPRGSVLFLTGILSLMALPWHDTMFLLLFSSTYIWHSVLLLLCTMIFLKLCLPQGEVSTPLFCMSVPLMVLAGNWQEGSALCLAGPLFVTGFMVSRKNLYKYITLLLFLTAGVITNILSPGLSARASNATIELNPFNWFQPYTLTGGVYLWPHNVLPIAFIIILVILMIFKRQRILDLYRGIVGPGWRRKICDIPGYQKTMLLCLLVVATNLALSLFFCVPRVSFTGNVFSIIGISLLVSIYYPNCKKQRKRLIRLSLCLVALLLSINMVLSIELQRRLSADHLNIIRLMTCSPDGMVFYDPIDYPHYSHYPWQWTINSFYVDQYSLHSLLDHPLIDKPLRLIPTDLYDIPADVTFNSPTLYHGHWISTSEPELPYGSKRTEVFPGKYPFMKINATVYTASGREKIRFFEIIPFTTSKGTPSERDLYYFRPVWNSKSEISDPAVKLISISYAKYW